MRRFLVRPARPLRTLSIPSTTDLKPSNAWIDIQIIRHSHCLARFLCDNCEGKNCAACVACEALIDSYSHPLRSWHLGICCGGRHMSHPSWPPNSIEHRSIEVAIRIPPGNGRTASHRGCNRLSFVLLKPDLARHSPILQRSSDDTGLGIRNEKTLLNLHSYTKIDPSGFGGRTVPRP
jgi:hypothetical protein